MPRRREVWADRGNSYSSLGLLFGISLENTSILLFVIKIDTLINNVLALQDSSTNGIPNTNN